MSVVEQVDTGDLKSPGDGLAGSNPAAHTNCRLVLVEWLDSRRPSGEWRWLSGYKAPAPIRCFSPGYVIAEGDVVALASTLAPDGDDVQAIGVLEIPARSVVAIHDLQEPSHG